MTWLPVSVEGKGERESVLGLHPIAYDRHEAFLQACSDVTDPDLMEPSRALMAHMIGCREELARHSQERLRVVKSRDYASLTGAQRAALDFVEQFLLDPGQVGAGTVAALEAEIGTSAVINFAAAIAAFEGSFRMSTILDLEPAG